MQSFAAWVQVNPTAPVPFVVVLAFGASAPACKADTSAVSWAVEFPREWN